MFRNSLRQAIPSMFHRRLLLLAVITVLMLAALGLRGVMMTTGPMHAQRKQKMEGALVHIRYAPTRRGKILDRNGVVLAEDRPGWNIAVHYSLLSGTWVQDAAWRVARCDPVWREASDDERAEILAKWQGVCAKRMADFWHQLAKAAKVEPQELFDKQDALVRKISTLHFNRMRSQWEKKVRDNHWAEDSREAREAWAGLQKSFVLAEERGRHVILADVPEEVRQVVQNILDEPEPEIAAPVPQAEAPPAESLWQKLGLVSKARVTNRGSAPDSPWLQVELQMVRARRYPRETVKLTFDRSTLPGDLQNKKPLELTVRGVGMHVLGYTRKARDYGLIGANGATRPSELDESPFKVKQSDGTETTDLHGLQAGDFVGAMGIEAGFEEVLRGRRGETRSRRTTSALAASNSHVAPVPGRDIQLALDIQLQARVEASLLKEVGLTTVNHNIHPWTDSSYYPGPHFKPKSTYTYADLGQGQLNGAALVLDAASGEVLAAASAPAIALEDIQNNLGALWADEINAPMADRVAGRALLPGSIMKPLVLTAAITEGVYQPGEIVDIPGYPFAKSPKAYRDFHFTHYPYKPWGRKTLDFAIAVSSSPPFVMLAQTREDRSGKPRLGPLRTLDWYDLFGFGHAPNAGIAASRGKLGFNNGPTPEVHACLVAMGQGDAILATPLQIGTAYCRFLNGHFGIQASFLKRPPGWQAKPPAGEKLIAPEAIAYTLKGMWMATHINGGTFTATRNYPDVFNCPGVAVWGKSGTAQTWPQRIDSNGNKKLDSQDTIIRAGDHGWTVALCAPEGERHPRFVIVTMLEYGGSGGRAAGPIANQVIHALKAEGYLEKIPKASPAPVVVNPTIQKAIDDAAQAEPEPDPLDTDRPAEDAVSGEGVL